MRITFDIYKRMVAAYIGEEGVQALSAEEWGEFTDFAKAGVKMHEAMVEHLPQSILDVKAMAELAKRFSRDAMDFASRYTFGKDQRGEAVNFLTLLGEIRMAHPSTAFFMAEFYVLLWAAEHKINMKLREQLGQKVPQYKTVPIMDKAPEAK